MDDLGEGGSNAVRRPRQPRQQSTLTGPRRRPGPGYVDADLVFADALGGPIHPRRLTEWFGKRRKAAGIPTGTLHILQRTAATLALTEGVPVHTSSPPPGRPQHGALDVRAPAPAVARVGGRPRGGPARRLAPG
jgi:hypothetical protein